jgi:hypothetical protein
MTVNMKIGASDGAASLSRAVINSAAGGDIVLVAGVAGQIIRCYKFLIYNTTALSLTFKDGVTALSGPMALPALGQLLLPMDGEPWFQASAGANLVLNASAATLVAGTIWFTQGAALAPP